eukprot:425199-Prymnesium_polylepis.1
MAGVPSYSREDGAFAGDAGSGPIGPLFLQRIARMPACPGAIRSARLSMHLPRARLSSVCRSHTHRCACLHNTLTQHAHDTHTQVDVLS